MPRRSTPETRFLAERLHDERLGMRDALARMHGVVRRGAQELPLGVPVVIGALAIGGVAALRGRFGVVRAIGLGTWRAGRFVVVALISGWVRDEARAMAPGSSGGTP